MQNFQFSVDYILKFRTGRLLNSPNAPKIRIIKQMSPKLEDASTDEGTKLQDVSVNENPMSSKKIAS